MTSSDAETDLKPIIIIITIISVSPQGGAVEFALHTSHLISAEVLK